jgi:hypothetical protein
MGLACLLMILNGKFPLLGSGLFVAHHRAYTASIETRQLSFAGVCGMLERAACNVGRQRGPLKAIHVRAPAGVV